MQSKQKSKNVRPLFDFIILLVILFSIGVFIVTTFRLADLGVGVIGSQLNDCSDTCTAKIYREKKDLRSEIKITELINRVSAGLFVVGLLYFVVKKPDKSQILEVS